MLTYREAQKLMERARHGRRKLENNTYLEARQPGEKWAGARHGNGTHYAVKLHKTDVVTLHPDGTYTYDTGGWRTVTTKARMNTYGNAVIWSERGSWMIAPRSGSWEDREQAAVPFADGVRVHTDGTISGAGIDETATRRQILKQVNAYVKGFVEHVTKNGLSDPGPGDCWGCSMTSAKGEGQSGRPEPFGVDHYFSHFEERYYVPSLVWRAVRRCGNPGFVFGWIQRGNVDLLERELRAHFRKLMPALVAYKTAQQEQRTAAA